jgi:hypothetical protein
MYVVNERLFSQKMRYIGIFEQILFNDKFTHMNKRFNQKIHDKGENVISETYENLSLKRIKISNSIREELCHHYSNVEW